MQIERLGPYQIVGKLGRGGMGTVYEGVNLETGEPAAVKLLSAALAEEEGFRVRFEAEIETLRKLNHPNIVKLFGFGEENTHLFYAMELIDGNSLEEELSRGRRFDWREVVRIVIEICHALRHAHDRGVIHRDIKPGNLLLASNGQVKLSDFGIARLFGNTRLTSAGSVLGTAEYMAPEQAAGKPVDQRSDLYSLGAVMYVLLARRPVFLGKSMGEVIYKQQFETPEPLHQHNDDIPKELEHIILQLLEKDPARRIPNATILGRCLEAMQHALPSPALTMQADPSYYKDEPPSDKSTESDAAVLEPGETWEDLLIKESELPDTQVYPAPSQSSAPPSDPQPAPDLPDTVSTVAIPAQTIAPTDAETKSTGHFVPVSAEELGKDETDESKPAIISLQTWALLAGLLLVGFSVLYFLQPPTANSLYSRISARTEDAKIDSLREAEDDIRTFLELYPSDSRASKLRKFQHEIDLDALETQFQRRVKGLVSTEDLLPIEHAYLEAISYERISSEQCIAKLQALVDLYQYSSEMTGPTGDYLTLAHRRIDRLKKDIEKYAPQQLDIIQKRLDEADSLLSTDPKHAQAMYRAVIELYTDKPWAAVVVHRAQTALDKISPRP
jgi:eukaryotic-like serine/threonine-protein kinase